MIRIALIGPDEELAADLAPYLKNLRGQETVKILKGYPNDKELERFVRASFPRLIFVSMSEPKKAEYIARWARQFAPGTQLIGVAQSCGNEVLRSALRSGMIECLGLPLDLAQLNEALNLAEKNLQDAPEDLPNRGKVVSFLPAKPGVGASTIAMNTALAMARRSEGRVLLADFDLNLGLQGFMLKLDRVHSAQEAGEHAHHMDADLWDALAVPKGNLDVLGSGYVSPGQRMETGATRDLLNFWRRNYQMVCADHSGNLERYSIELLMDSEEILLISTAEIAPLHLARTKMNLLREYGLSEKVSLVVNRVSRRDSMSKEDIEATVGIPVTMQIPNDYARVEAALRKGSQVDVDSPLGKRYEALAFTLLQGATRDDDKDKRKSRFMKLFALDSLFANEEMAAK
jgi:pilus assembly protein CpaE